MKNCALRCLTLVLMTSSLPAQEFHTDYLRDVKGLLVIVEGLGEADGVDGLTEQVIETAVSLKLRLAGIRVWKTGTKDYIYVNINSLKRKNNDSYIFSVSVELKQGVLVRHNMAVNVATTWSKNTVGITPKNYLKDDAMDFVNQVMDEFLNIYLEQNPR